ncbi:Hypothetical protein CINCED_3A004342 [Cinara cedri]|uniref:Uncharacterized protein n=1 Tax=Cinara cedri TaxID=506608 RepID=A0A5E4MUZ8_9HEMI|nr:Hypothetical protein CINCED_3A004342 [Cinara cedri]
MHRPPAPDVLSCLLPNAPLRASPTTTDAAVISTGVRPRRVGSVRGSRCVLYNAHASSLSDRTAATTKSSCQCHSVPAIVPANLQARLNSLSGWMAGETAS